MERGLKSIFFEMEDKTLILLHTKWETNNIFEVYKIYALLKMCD